MKENKLNSNSEGGLLDNLINKGKLPEVSVSVENSTIIKLAVMLIIVSVIFLLISTILKSAFN